MVYEYMYRQSDDKKVLDAFNAVQNSGFNQDLGTAKAAKMYFSPSAPGPNAFAGDQATPPKFTN